MKLKSALSRALTNFNMITGSVTAIRWASVSDQPVTVRSFTLKKTPGAGIPHYTMVDALGVDKPLGSASDQVYADLELLSTFLKDVPGVTIDQVVGGTEVDEDTGEILGKQVTRIIFDEPYPVFMLQKVETKNAGRTVFKVVAFDPVPVAAPDTTGAEVEEVPGGNTAPWEQPAAAAQPASSKSK